MRSARTCAGSRSTRSTSRSRPCSPARSPASSSPPRARSAPIAWPSPTAMRPRASAWPSSSPSRPGCPSPTWPTAPRCARRRPRISPTPYSRDSASLLAQPTREPVTLALAMSLPALDTRVLLRIPDREVLAGRIDEIGHGWIDVELRHAPRTPLTHLERHWVFMEYVEPAGLVRIMGQVSLSPTSSRVGPPTFRFTHRETVQLLRRREFAGGIVHARATLTPVEREGVAHATQTVAIGSSEFAVESLPGAREGELY